MASVVDGFISQGRLNARGVRAVTGRPGNLHEMGVGWAGMGGNLTKSVCPGPPGG